MESAREDHDIVMAVREAQRVALAGFNVGADSVICDLSSLSDLVDYLGLACVFKSKAKSKDGRYGEILGLPIFSPFMAGDQCQRPLCVRKLGDQHYIAEFMT